MRFAGMEGCMPQGPQVISELTVVFGYKLVETERNETFLFMSDLVLYPSDDYRREYTLLYLVLEYIFGEWKRSGADIVRISGGVEHSDQRQGASVLWECPSVDHRDVS